ncbi:DUF3455 domain-containing protein [Ferrovum myxofaciens]|uniref:DUF3455 domain-containing protein n=3 Tax=root TaxID=1 RepID=A0A9E6SXH0_9PROT|nr:DUF3455 domain-containing protein [Ferrovum myxofaciens]NDU90429.1 DUF3455 domain-containing protein [Ferrovum sp.]MBU6995798.1 DUF3455 domain-containing protein [Ferrovum myxofaciens]QKE39418.1 MAG: DUF3455 domain-containing protein [Ferrovum myxofaciens]QWY74691.1 MAG: DUF3455 domain-containing protein [Ferrovum myxofaciens]QWY77437.1 MAG: DUF3455 domain-containing protein [Ferrovum myxofaciens]
MRCVRFPKSFSLLGLVFLTLTSCATKQDAKMPASLTPPPDQKMILQAMGEGVQTYVCEKSGDNAYAWTAQGPVADLYDGTGNALASLVKGPRWSTKEGSAIAGVVVMASAPAPKETEDIPWVLWKGGDAVGKGPLAQVTSIRQIHTRGGLGPVKGCTVGKEGKISKVTYTATYQFFAP